LARNSHCGALFELNLLVISPFNTTEESSTTALASPPFAAQILTWQRAHGRHNLPWQSTDPYRVWLSEIMLQQTQVSTVMGYYQRFLTRFPQVQNLANASQDEVLALWSGLGYYSRARNLHRCAQIVLERYAGQFPRSSRELQTLPGIGPSTAAAIAAFCFGERVAILDGNVKRVLTRWMGYAHDLSLSSNVQQLWGHATALLPAADQMPAYTQGLMDLGATVCTTRKPSCHICPVQDRCQAAQQGTPERYPVKTRKLKRGYRESIWLLLSWRQKLCLFQRPQTGIWAGLWSLPEYEQSHTLKSICQAWPGQAQTLPSLTHTLTHLDWTLHPQRWALPDTLTLHQVQAIAQDCSSHAEAKIQSRWLTQNEVFSAGIPAPLRKLLEQNPLVWA
jgi:A/G-specific adenine glycosylase